MNFSENLVRKRKSLGLSQEALAEKIDVSRQAVSKWETGDAMPDVAKLAALADALGTDMDVLYGRTAEPQPSAYPKKSSKKLIIVLCAVLAVLLICPATILLLNVAAPTNVPSLPDVVSVSGVAFRNEGEGILSYSFAPSVVGEGYTYEITFSYMGDPPQTEEVSCVGGVCSGTVFLPNRFCHSVSVVISNGAASRAITVATDLNFSSAGGVSWLPVE